MGKQHTAGPWNVGRAIATTGVMPIKSGHFLIAHVTHPKWGYEDTPQEESECHANAALISAAPDLLQALEQVYSLMISAHSHASTEPETAWRTMHKAEDVARIALAKAKVQ